MQMDMMHTYMWRDMKTQPDTFLNFIFRSSYQIMNRIDSKLLHSFQFVRVSYLQNCFDMLLGTYQNVNICRGVMVKERKELLVLF